MNCVNKAFPGYQELSEKFGDSLAESIVIRNNYVVPSIEEAIDIVRGSKVLQFKNAINYVDTTVSNSVDSLLNNLDKIVQVRNGKSYVVRGSKFSEKEASLAATEIKNKNISFLNQINTFVRGKLFKLPSNTEMAIREDKKIWNNLTEDDNGNYVFFHRSDKDLTKKGIDPKKFGSNTQLTGAEERSRSVPASFYYTETDYAEPGTGRYKHIVRVPKDKVYPFNADPLNFYEEAERRFKEKYPDRAFSPNEQIGWIGVVASENGFEMLVAEWDGRVRAESIKKQMPQLIERPPVDGGFYSSNVVEELTDEVFLINKKKYSKKGYDVKDATKKLYALRKESEAKNFSDADEFAKFLLPSNLYNKYKPLYKLASSVRIAVDVVPYVHPGQLASFNSNMVNFPVTLPTMVNSWEEVTEALNHEIIHGLLMRSWGNKYELHKQLLPIFQEVLKHQDKANAEVKFIINYIGDTSDSFEVKNFDAEVPEGINPRTGEPYTEFDYPGTPDFEELITYTFTNPEFLKFMESIPYETDKPSGQSIFGKLLDVLRNFIKSIVSGQTTAADAVNNIVDNHFKDFDRVVKAYNEVQQSQFFSPNRGLANPILTGQVTKQDLGLDAKNVTNGQIAAALHAYYKKNFKLLRSNEWGEKSVDLLSDYAADEIALALDLYGSESGKGWYTEDYKKAMNELSKILPELNEDQELQSVATMFIAVSSNSNDPENNLLNIIPALEYYKQTTRLPEDMGVGTGASAVNQTMAKINKLFDLFDGDVIAVSDFLQTEMPVGKAMELAKGVGVKPVYEWGKDNVFPVSVTILGPKIGAFYANLSGMGGLPTIDRWAARTISRYRGDARTQVDPKQLEKFIAEQGLEGKTEEEVLEVAREHAKEYSRIQTKRGKYASMTKEERNVEFGKYRRGNTIALSIENVISIVPGTKAEQRRFRDFSFKVMKEAQRKVKERTGEDLTVSDVQAILWLYEKRLFETLGVKQKPSPTFSEASKKIVEKINKQRFLDFWRGMNEQEVSEMKSLGLENYFNEYVNRDGSYDYNAMFRDKEIFYTPYLELNEAQQSFVDSISDRNRSKTQPRGMAIKQELPLTEKLKSDKLSKDNKNLLAVLSGLIIHNGAEKITKLDPNRSVGGARAIYGKGIYFSDSPYKAADYGGVSTYVDASKLSTLDTKKALDQSFIDEINKAAEKVSDDLIASAIYNVMSRGFSEQLARGTDITIDDARKTVFDKYRYDQSNNWNSLLKDMGYDSVKNGYEYVYFDTNNNNLVDDVEQFISDSYYKAKGDQSNPELVEYLEKFIDVNEVIENKPSVIQDGKRLFSEPNPETTVISESYKAEKGITYGPGQQIYSLDTNLSKEIADAFDQMENNPSDPLVKEAYELMAKETIDQHNAITKAGYVVEIYEGEGEPYPNSQAMLRDVKENKHMYILSTAKDFGQTPITDQQREENALLRDSGLKDVNGKTLLVNDVFRFVHDFFGHSERGNSFGPIGEENAWDVHARMFSPLARRAMTTETRGQNSWVNFGKHMRNEDGSIKKKGDPGYLGPRERPFAEQKMGLLPEKYSNVMYEQQVEEPLIPESLNVPVEIDNNVLNTVAENNKEKAPTEKPFDTQEPKERLQKADSTNYANESQKGVFALSNIIEMFRSKFNIPVETVNEPDNFFRGKYVNGKIIINEAFASAYTPFHELFHPIVLIMKNENPDLYNSLMEELKSTEQGKAEIERVKQKYPELSEVDQMDEALVEMLGQMAGGRYVTNQSKLDQFLDWLKSILAKVGIDVKGFKPTMSMSDVADLILDPSFRMDLQKAVQFEELAEYNQKADPIQEERFNNVMDNIIKKLAADTNIPAKNEEEKTRKFFSSQQIKAFEANRKDLEAIDSFILSALSNTKKISEKFEEFRRTYESKKVKTLDDIKKMADLLYEIENVLVLYSDARPLVRSMSEIFPDEEDNFGSLFNYLNRQDDLINGYKNYGSDIIAEWLMPYMGKAINEAKSNGTLTKIITPEIFNKVKGEMEKNGINDLDTIVRQAMKEEIKSVLSVAKEDAGFFENWLSGVLNSKDSISQLVGLALSDEVQKGLKKALVVKEKITDALKKYRGSVTFSTEASEEEFYKKYLRQANSYEYVGLDENGNEKYEYIKRWAFHEEYFWDDFYKAKREFFETLGVRPNKSDKQKYDAWEAKRKQWYNDNTVPVQKGNKIEYIPAAKYKNHMFQGMMADPYYNVLYTNYKNANDIAGGSGLKYGIIPQVSKGKNAFSGLTKKKSFKEGIKKVGANVTEIIGAEEQIYYAENIEGFERKTIPINHIRLLEEEDLSFNLADSVFKYAATTSKYEALKGVEPHVMVLKNFLNGNSYLKVDKRKALQNSAKGVKKLIKGSKTLMPGDGKKVNDMLNGFINDVMYGESDERSIIKLWGSRFVVYKKGDTSNNGQPMKQVVKNFEDLKGLLEKQDLNFSDFKQGSPVEINGYVVELSNPDVTLSLNKVGNFAGITTALTNMALNVNSLVMNVGIGNISSFVEATGGKHFKLKDWAWGQKEYWKNVLSGSFFEDVRGGKQSKLSQLMIHYNAMQGEFEDSLGKKIDPGVANKLLRRDNLFVVQRVGEHQIQGVGMLAMLKSQKVKLQSGEEISLYDAWELDQDNNIKLRSDIVWSNEADVAFSNRLQGVNKELNGNFSKLDKAKLQRTWWGRAIMMFRKHIYNAFEARYGKEKVNYERGIVTEGYYRTFWKMTLDQLSTFILNKKFKKLNDQEVYAVRKLTADLAVIAVLFTLFKSTDDDDDENEFTDNVAFWSRRLLSDTSQYAPVVGWLELWKIVKDPSASVNTLGKYYEAFTQLILDPEEEYERSGPGYTKGELKWKVKMGKVIPLYRQFVNLQDPENMLEYYKLNVKSIYNTKKSDEQKAEE